MTYRRILVPVDGSLPANAGLREALKLAKDRQARLCLLHVIDEAPAFSTPDGGIGADAIWNALKRRGQLILRGAQRTTAAGGVRSESMLLDSAGARVADVIARLARRWRADLIVMGTHGRSGVNRMLMGSNAERVVRIAGTPVLLAKARAAAKRGGRRARG